jgi:hypothetical protein
MFLPAFCDFQVGGCDLLKFSQSSGTALLETLSFVLMGVEKGKI